MESPSAEALDAAYGVTQRLHEYCIRAYQLVEAGQAGWGCHLDYGVLRTKPKPVRLNLCPVVTGDADGSQLVFVQEADDGRHAEMDTTLAGSQWQRK